MKNERKVYHKISKRYTLHYKQTLVVTLMRKISDTMTSEFRNKAKLLYKNCIIHKYKPVYFVWLLNIFPDCYIKFNSFSVEICWCWVSQLPTIASLHSWIEFPIEQLLRLERLKIFAI